MKNFAIMSVKQKWPLLLVGIIFFLIPQAARAEKSITLSSSVSSVVVGKEIDIPIKIDSGGEKVNAVGFNIDFPTENLEGLMPARAGSVFPFWVVESSTRLDCGIQGQDGFSGSGLITTLRFKGREAGDATISLRNIRVLFAGNPVVGFAANDINLSILPEGQTPVVTQETSTGSKKLVVPSQTQQTTPTQPQAPQQTSVAAVQPTETFGSQAQVSGTKGSQPEEPLKTAEVKAAEASIQGLFGKSSILWTSILPTLLLIALVIYLGVRLYFTEKRRHANMEHILDKQLGTLAALESKIDLVGEKGEEGKNQYIEELEAAKKEIITESGKSKKDPGELKTAPQSKA